MEHLYTLARTAITFVVILVLARIIGSKQLSQLTFFNYITGITIGSIAANIISRSTNRLSMNSSAWSFGACWQYWTAI